MIAASGQAFGFRRSVPHMIGVGVGFAVMLLALGFGLVGIFKLYPDLHGGLRVIGALYLLYLAWRIASAGDAEAEESRGRPLSVLEAALFQWVNAKAWTLAIGVVTAFTTVGGNLAGELAVVVAIFTIAIAGTMVVWCLFGVGIRTFLTTPRQRRLVNLAMAAAIVLSIGTLFL
jgi:threonine/homoserine/homoserine lactone efflux protein